MYHCLIVYWTWYFIFKKKQKKILKFAFFVVIKVHDVLLIVHAQQK